MLNSLSHLSASVSTSCSTNPIHALPAGLGTAGHTVPVSIPNFWTVPLSTDPDLSASAVVEAYASRWSVEPLFAALTLTDGMGAMWQRRRRTLLRWLHLVQIGRALLVLLTARAEPEVLALLRVGGWRKAATLTPGLLKDALARRFGDIEAFRLLPTTQTKTGPARGTGPPLRSAAA